jgi:hypothetical protein
MFPRIGDDPAVGIIAKACNHPKEDRALTVDQYFVLALTIGCVVLLALEWRLQSKILRIGTVVLALATLMFFEGNSRRAARSAFGAAPEERVTNIGGTIFSGYESGVLTMEEAINHDSAMGQNERWLALAVLVWLACSPTMRRKSKHEDHVGATSRDLDA